MDDIPKQTLVHLLIWGVQVEKLSKYSCLNQIHDHHQARVCIYIYNHFMLIISFPIGQHIASVHISLSILFSVPKVEIKEIGIM